MIPNKFDSCASLQRSPMIATVLRLIADSVIAESNERHFVVNFVTLAATGIGVRFLQALQPSELHRVKVLDILY
jgi:hypothetical protein